MYYTSKYTLKKVELLNFDELHNIWDSSVDRLPNEADGFDLIINKDVLE